MPAPRRLTPVQSGKNTRNLTNRAVQRQLRDGIDLDFVNNVFYAKAPGRQAQVVQSIEQLFPYAGTNQGYYRASNGLLVPSVNNVPRIEYDSSNACQGLLEEIARTNLCVYSQRLDVANWAKSATSIGTDVTTAPDGTLTADRIIEDGSIGSHLITQTINFTAGTTYTLTAYVKAAERSWILFAFGAAAFSVQCGYHFDVGNGALGTILNSASATITPYANGWYKCTITATATITAGANIQIITATGDVGTSYAGDGTSGIYVWGVQVEAGAFGTSYMPTDAATVTRGSETFTRVIGSEIAPGLGTFMVEYRTNNSLLSTFATAMSLDDNSTSNRIFMFRNNVGTRTAGSVSGGASQFSSANGDNGSTFRKCVMVYSTAGYRHFMDGALVGSVGAALVPAVTRLRLGNSAYGADYLNGHIRRFKYFPRLLTDAEAIAETV